MMYLTLLSLLAGAAFAGCDSLIHPPQHNGAPGCETACTFQVKDTYPHDRAAFTQGLAYEDGVLYEGTGINGRSSLRKVELATGKVLKSVPLDAQYFGEGITIWKDTIIQLTWQSNIGFVYDKATFAKLRDFEYPTEGWGITHNGTHLIMSDGTDTLYFLDPETFVEVNSIPVRDGNAPLKNLNELEFINGCIYANVWQTDRIVRINPADGKVVGDIDLTGILPLADRIPPVDVLNGIAYDPAEDRFFVTGKLWPKLYHIDLVSREK
jgi:glutamine cyclotransferase